MPFETTTHLVAKAVPGPPGQRSVHGRIVGPTDETYPPGTGGSLPHRSTLVYVLTRITTVRDTVSGHTHTVREVYVGGGDEATEKAAHRARMSPGSSIALGRPVVSDTAPVFGSDPMKEASSEEASNEEASAQTTEVQAPIPVPKGAAKGPTTSAQINK